MNPSGSLKPTNHNPVAYRKISNICAKGKIGKQKENLVYSFIKSQSRTDDYKTADINGCRHTDSEQQTSIDTNTNDISDNRQGLTETFEATLTNTDDVAINRQAIEELCEMITAESEVK